MYSSPWGAVFFRRSYTAAWPGQPFDDAVVIRPPHPQQVPAKGSFSSTRLDEGAILTLTLPGWRCAMRSTASRFFSKRSPTAKKFREEIIVFAEPDAVVFRFEKQCLARAFSGRSIRHGNELVFGVFSIFGHPGIVFGKNPARVSLGGCISPVLQLGKFPLGPECVQDGKAEQKGEKKQNDGELFQLLP